MKVWIQSAKRNVNPISSEAKWKPVLESCESALHGAELSQVEWKRFERADFDKIPKNDMVVGSVETVRDYLNHIGVGAPGVIDHTAVREFMIPSQIIHTDFIPDQTFPLFVKPANEIKAFTGFVAKNAEDVAMFSYGYVGMVSVSPVVNILSEWRCYISQGSVLKIAHYLGDPFVFPNAEVVSRVVKLTKLHNKEASYTIDFGVLVDGRVVVIEMNDGWALGNYGLPPYDYFQFLRRRWVQMNPNVYMT